jgi:hypothetical protein
MSHEQIQHLNQSAKCTRDSCRSGDRRTGYRSWLPRWRRRIDHSTAFRLTSRTGNVPFGSRSAPRTRPLGPRRPECHGRTDASRRRARGNGVGSGGGRWNEDLFSNLRRPKRMPFRLPNLGPCRSERVHTATPRHVSGDLYEGLMAAKSNDTYPHVWGAFSTRPPFNDSVSSETSALSDGYPLAPDKRKRRHV